MNTPASILRCGAINAALAIGAGAFAAHGLKNHLSEYSLAVFKTGAEYHLMHSVALVLMALLVGLCGPQKSLIRSAWFFVCGIIFFSGSLYALALTGVRALGAITPLGGVSFILAWLILAWNAHSLPFKTTASKGDRQK